MGGCHGVAGAGPPSSGNRRGYSRSAVSCQRRGSSETVILALHVMPICAGEFLGRLRMLALAILPGCRLRAKAREVLECVVTKRRAQAEKGYRDQKAWHLG